MATSFTPGALALVAATALACSPVCDEADLRAAAEAFAGGSERRQAGLDALRDACPTLPPALAQRLAGDASPLTDAEAPAWQALLDRTCPDPAKPTPERATRRGCDLDRHRLLTGDEVFAPGDLDTFMLFEWLVGGRVDRSLAAQVATPLLTAKQLERWSVALPRGKRDVSPSGVGPQIVLSPTELLVDSTRVLALERGRPPAGAFTRHVSPALREILETTARTARTRAERDGRPWDDTATLLADRTTPFATLADVLFTASRAGFYGFELLVHDGEELRAHHIAVPFEWLPPDDVIRERKLEVLFTVGADEVIARVAGDAPTRFTQPFGAALATHVATLKNLHPSETVATLRVDGQIPLQSVVSLMDAVSGETCALRGAFIGERIPDDCLFWQHVLDLDPPLIRDAAP